MASIKTDIDAEYKISRVLGSGSTAIVYKAKERAKPHRRVALKCIKKRAMEKHSEVIENEIGFLKARSNEYLVSLLTIHHFDGCPVLVFEAAAGNLHDMVEAQLYLMDKILCQSIIRQILRGLIYIHSEGYIHGDIKLGNLLVGHDKKIKIADFGYCCKIADAEKGIVPLNGTPEFIPPECFIEKKWNETFDIWSLGIVTFVLLTKKYPFKVRHSKDLPKFKKNLKQVAEDGGFDWEELSAKYTKLPKDSIPFLNHLLNPEYKKRLSAKTCLGLKWIDVSKSLTKNKSYGISKLIQRWKKPSSEESSSSSGQL
eukprot:CAMPEP_0168526574 /NCGR_PEP_ID=MMETSP0405-20121227/12063_1 /TAXON_ID=498012 /ORGANISM="Trichosphaerium sp, Strain Am-I-7 wt" /LENGTH=312 /DNA_ID=CAMNT_0008549471 /DNA_START=11 /DNA_END=950 /DNA_ORIENTATION=-